jgi:H+/Cl- antiporter ClcA
LAVAAGAALGSFVVLDALGLHLGGSRWDGILIAMAIGVAVSVRAPMVAVVMLSEMTGDFRLLPLSALVVALAVLLDRRLDRRRRRAGHHVPATLHDEDA